MERWLAVKSALRLRRFADFAAVHSDGRFYRHRALTLACRANGLPHNRYGIVAGRRLGIAVVRNRVKRRLRAAIYQMHAGLRPGYDVVVIARPIAREQPFDELKRILSGLFMQAKLIEAG